MPDSNRLTPTYQPCLCGILRVPRYASVAAQGSRPRDACGDDGCDPCLLSPPARPFLRSGNNVPRPAVTSRVPPPAPCPITLRAPTGADRPDACFAKLLTCWLPSPTWKALAYPLRSPHSAGSLRGWPAVSASASTSSQEA